MWPSLASLEITVIWVERNPRPQMSLEQLTGAIRVNLRCLSVCITMGRKVITKWHQVASSLRRKPKLQTDMSSGTRCLQHIQGVPPRHKVHHKIHHRTLKRKTENVFEIGPGWPETLGRAGWSRAQGYPPASASWN